MHCLKMGGNVLQLKVVRVLIALRFQAVILCNYLAGYLYSNKIMFFKGSA